MTSPVDNANQDLQEINNRQSVGDRTQVIGEEINNARSEFSSPAEYNQYINAMRGGISDPNLLKAIDIFDSGSTEQQMAESLMRNGDEIYKVLDTYAQKQGNGQLDGDGSDADGNIGVGDVDAFLNDIKVDGSKAQELFQKNPELLEQLTAMKTKGEDFSLDNLLGDLGYLDGNSDGNIDRDPFVKDHNPDGATGSVEVMNNGKLETIIDPSGRSTAFHYDSNGNIDGMNYSEFVEGQQVSHKVTRDANGQFVDENGNPASHQAPFQNDSSYGFYKPTENPNVFTKTTIDKQTGNPTLETVDISQPGIAIAGLNRPGNVDPNNQESFKVGNLDVRAGGLQDGQAVADAGLNAQGQAVYEIKPGDNLTNIVRNALSLPANYDGPELQTAMRQLADANKYTNLNEINAGTPLIIPPDWNTRPVVVPPPAPAAVA